MNKTVCKSGMLAALVGCACLALNGDTNLTSSVRAAFDVLRSRVNPRELRYGFINEALNFNDGLSQTPHYLGFARVVSNNWRTVLANMNGIATNNVERLLLIGTGRVFDENCYIDYLDELATMKTNGVLTANELECFEASSRYDQMSCLTRRYREPRIRALVNKLKVAKPMGGYWDDVLSGVAYTNYLQEVSAGLWGGNPPR